MSLKGIICKAICLGCWSWGWTILCPQFSPKRRHRRFHIRKYLCTDYGKSDGKLSSECSCFAMWSWFVNRWSLGLLQSNGQRSWTMLGVFEEVRCANSYAWRRRLHNQVNCNLTKQVINVVFRNVARCWAYETSVALDTELSNSRLKLQWTCKYTCFRLAVQPIHRLLRSGLPIAHHSVKYAKYEYSRLLRKSQVRISMFIHK